MIEIRGVGFGIYQRAFKAATGKDMGQFANISGRTELDIAAEILCINGLEPTDEAIAGLAGALTDGYEAARSELATRGRALPGAKEMLALLAEEPTICQSLLTGNPNTPAVDRALAACRSRTQGGHRMIILGCVESEDQAVAVGGSVAAQRWSGMLDELLGRVAGRFGRVEPRRRVRGFVLGLLADLPRKNCWTIAVRHEVA